MRGFRLSENAINKRVSVLFLFLDAFFLKKIIPFHFFFVSLQPDIISRKE